ncbi:helix-turn-helix transcriptional regulator [Pengzhenrongella sp.]|jgi:transcriptional regulator with XRE-family HTH domain|uniref:helix-turn-helix transcriptional regulator n=1 Tax=Pengzhenrongella sp. TaxID=2888820 RepID=UPI002F9441B8
MDNKDEVRDFLVSRRSRLTPEQTGLIAGSNRRVTGLRRGEVAVLADISVEYYAKVERGNLAGVSESVLHSLARALQLDDAEASHLFDLWSAANASPTRRTRRNPRKTEVRAGLQQTLDAITNSPAIVRNGRMDLIATNELGRALYSDVYLDPQRPPNFARYTFLNRERSEDFYPDWDGAADVAVAIMRTEAGRDPHDRDLQDLVGELSTRSADFRERWAKHDVRLHAAGTKSFHHPVVGDLDLTYEALDLSADLGLNLCIYTAEAGSPSDDGLRLLASWAATQEGCATEARVGRPGHRHDAGAHPEGS